MRCNICGCSRAKPLLAGLETVLQCGGCGVGYSAQPLAPSAQQLFGSVYRDYAARAAQWRHEAALRVHWLLSDARPRRLIEIGCAGGFFVEAARQSGIDATGVELSPWASAYAREALGVPVRTGRFEDLAGSDDFDALCAFHVLEHVDDPRGFLRAAFQCVRPGGVLALEVPNVASARARRERHEWACLQTDHHVWHFSPAPLAELVKGAGFRVDQLDSVSPRFYLRRRDRIARPGLALLAQDVLATGSARSVHPSQGDYLRVLAHKP